ncbi:hypothetical protein [Massilia genomosp. 1]|uniref:Bacteriophage tail tape measure N-terminal domain-containing protein n=1 Tax=Massilia genomosp. 1 TaxID=2609280 RepID=A0ABX0MQ41_9BURK|nr:hypothetical protein [Massilia genomosp. 1]NHZ62608.1 hypothetical protein [Massilia genomosp. 1]
MANIEKYRQGMESAKKIGSDSMSFLASVFDKIKSAVGGMWDSIKSMFSNVGGQAKGAFSSLSDSASSAFGKVIGMLPGFNSALDKTKDKMGETEEKSDGLMKKIGIGIVVALTAAAAAITVLVKKGLDADAALASVAVSTGVAASQISRFEATALRSGVSAQEFGGSMGKLREKMKEAAASDGSTFFSKLGVDIVDANNALLKTDDVTIQVAKKIADMSSEAEKYAAASKAGFEGQVQVLEDIAHASDLSATTTDEQAAAVVRLGKIWHEILPGGKGMWAQISSFLTSSLTPAMTETSITILNSKNTIVGAFNDIFNTGSMLPKFGAQIKEWGQSASQWFSSVAESATSATVKMMQFVASKTGLGDPNAVRKLAAPAIVPGVVPLTSATNTPVTKDSEKEYNALTKAIQQKIEVQRMEIRTGGTLTEGQRLLLKMNNELRDGTVTMTDAQKAQRTEVLNALIVQEKLNKQAQESHAKGEAAASKEVASLTTLVAAIKAKTAENETELATGLAATENQKFAIKLHLEEERSKKNLSAADLARLATLKAEAVAQLAANKIAEDAVKAQQAEKDVAKYIGESTLARQESAAALAVEYEMAGKSADAREIAMVAVKQQTALEKFLAQEKTAGKIITEEEIERLQAEVVARTAVEQAAMGQAKALGYARQLEDENKKFAAESIDDPAARAAALLKIDTDIWAERIRLAGEGTDAQRVLQTQYDTWYVNRSKNTLTAADAARAKDALDILTAVDAATRDAAAGMQASFGGVGTAIGGLTTALSGYAVQQQAIAAQLASVKADPTSSREKIAKAEIAASRASAQAQVKSYGDMAGAAKGFFKENSTGYKVMEKTEKAFRAYEMAMAIKNMLAKSGLLSALTSMFVTSKATETAVDATSTTSSIGNSLLRAGASMTAGVAKAFEQLGIWGFVGAAAIIAFMGAMGVFGGTGGGGPAPGTFEERQKTQGTGTVLGDDTAKSESISKSLEIMEQNSSRELGYQNSMLVALRNIESSLGGAAKGIFQTAGLTGGSAFGTTNTATKSTFGSDKSTTITDTGIKFSGTLGQLRAGGGKGTQYEDVTKTSDGGMFHGNSSRSNTNVKALADSAMKPFTLIFDNMGDLLVGAGVKLGADSAGLTKAINQIGIDFAVSTRELKGQDLVDALSAGVSVAFDKVTAAVFPQIEGFQKVGEGMGETLVRVAANYSALDHVLASIGMTFGATGMSSLRAREDLITAAGGMDKFAEVASGFAENFLTEAERLAPVQKFVTSELAAMGFASVKTRDDFKAAVLSFSNDGKLLDSTQAATYTRLISLQEAFASIVPALENIGKVAKTAAEAATENLRLMDEYASLTLTPEALLKKQRTKELDDVDPSNRWMLEQVHKAQDSKTDGDKLAAANKVLQDQIDTFTTDSTKVRALAIAGMKESTVALYDILTTHKANAAIASEAKAAADALKSTNKGWQDQIDTLSKVTMTPDELREFETKGMEKSTIDLYDKLKAMQVAQAADAAIKQAKKEADEANARETKRIADEAQAAADKLRAAWQSATDAIFDEIKRVRGEAAGTGALSLAGAQAEFAMRTAQARAGSEEAAKMLPALSQRLLELAEANAATAFDLARIRARTLGSLTDTGNSLVGQHGLTLPSFAVGTNYLPSDMIAQLHEGERIVPKADNLRLEQALAGDGGNAELVAEMRALRVEVASLRQPLDKTAANTKRGTDILEVVTSGGDAMRMEMA